MNAVNKFSCWFFLLLLLIYSHNANSQIVKCTDKKTGKITYSNGGCADGQSSKAVGVVENTVPAYNTQPNPMVSQSSPRYDQQGNGLDRILRECDAAIKAVDRLRSTSDLRSPVYQSAVKKMIAVCPFDSGGDNDGCRSVTVNSPVPVLFNQDEVMELSSGDIVRNNSYQYNYAYKYNPRVSYCRGDGKIIYDGKSMRVSRE